MGLEIINPLIKTVAKKAYVAPKMEVRTLESLGLKMEQLTGDLVQLSSKNMRGRLDSEELFHFAKEHPFTNFDGTLSKDGLLLCRMDDRMPVNGVIQCMRDETKYIDGCREIRESVHFSLNHAVLSHDCGSWDNKKYLYCIPYKKVENIVGGTSTDIFTKGSVKLPKSSVIVRQNYNIPCGEYKVIAAEQVEGFEHLLGSYIIETNEQPYKVANSIIKKMGYKIQPSGLYSWGDTNQPEFIKFMQKEGKLLALHSNTPNCDIEILLEALNFLSATNSKWVVNEKIISGYYANAGEVFKMYSSMNKVNGDWVLSINYKEDLLTIINSIKEFSQKTKYPIDIDINKLYEIINKSDSPKKAISKIRKKLKINAYTEIHNIDALASDNAEIYSNYRNTLYPAHVKKEYDEIAYKYMHGEIEFKEFEKLLNEWEDNWFGYKNF